MPPESLRRRRVAARVTASVAGVLVIVSVWYVQAPPRSSQDYRKEARQTAETLSAQLETARLWVRYVREGSATHEAATVAFRETESNATAAVSAFAAHDPPPGTDALRRRLTTLGDEVASALADLRILAHRARWDQLPERPGPLASLSRDLKALARTAAP